jgi:hypothetical protein
MSKTTSTIKTESVTDTNETDTDTDKFIKMCMSGKINDAKQFYIYNSSVDIHADADKAFTQALYLRHLHIAEWLLNISVFIQTPIDITIHNHLLFENLYSNNDLDGIIWLISKYTESRIILPFHKIWNSIKINVTNNKSHWVTRYLIRNYIRVITDNTFNVYFLINTYCKNKAIAESLWLYNILTPHGIIPQTNEFLKIECSLATHCNHSLCYNTMYNLFVTYRRT